VVERQGRVRLVGKDGKLAPEPFLDLTGAALPLGGEVQHQFIEQGLYSIAFHPKYAENGFFYVHYSSLPFNGDGFVVRFKVSKDPNKADPESAKVIYHSERPYYNHNGGQIAFGRDGYLYIGSGDGGWEGDPLNSGQSLDTDLGKILRIDVDKEADVTRAYQIPATNPLAFKPQLMALFGVTDEFARLHPNARPEIWAYGLRNPWSFQFDNKTGDSTSPRSGRARPRPFSSSRPTARAGRTTAGSTGSAPSASPRGRPTVPGSECLRPPSTRTTSAAP
jgi:glucose/arabinose dehydrogenase